MKVNKIDIVSVALAAAVLALFAISIYNCPSDPAESFIASQESSHE